MITSSFPAQPIVTDNIIFLYDNGEKNMVASALRYGEKIGALEDIDFRVVFCGTSIDAMNEKPFSSYPDRLIHYKALGILEEVDKTWKREALLSKESLEALRSRLIVNNKVWTGVSCQLFSQILSLYQEETHLDVACLRDNPSPIGDTDYFVIADQVQQIAKKVLVPSSLALEFLIGKETRIVGHSPMEDWLEEAVKVDYVSLCQRLSLDANRFIIVYSGSYGEHYTDYFKRFLSLIPTQKYVQVIIAPHPKYRGAIEKELCAGHDWKNATFRIIGNWEENPQNKASTQEAICIADLVIISDPTSTVVFQATGIGKKVALVNHLSATAVEAFIVSKGFIERLNTSEEVQTAYTEPSSNTNDPFTLMGIPREGNRLLWEAFLQNN